MSIDQNLASNCVEYCINAATAGRTRVIKTRVAATFCTTPEEWKCGETYRNCYVYKEQ